MTHYDYKVVPAPKRAKRVKGVHGAEELFALTLTEAINEVARQGWEYVRAEHLPAETPRGWFRGAVAGEQTRARLPPRRASSSARGWRRCGPEPAAADAPEAAGRRADAGGGARGRRPAAAHAAAPRAAGAPARAAARRGRGRRRDAAAPGAAARAAPRSPDQPGGSAARSSARACTPPRELVGRAPCARRGCARPG